VYDHAPIASNRHWCVGNVGRRVWLLALDGRNAELAGGFPSDPILSGPRQTVNIMRNSIIFIFNVSVILSRHGVIFNMRKTLFKHVVFGAYSYL
jgi:hypothetical protein